MKFPSRRALTGVGPVAAILALSACGGGGGSEESTQAPSSSPGTAGLWKGGISSTVTGQSTGVVGFVAADGQSMWMTTDGRVMNGQMPVSGDHFQAPMTAYMSAGANFPDGTNRGALSLMVDSHPQSRMLGRFAGTGDSGGIDVHLNTMWNRPASLTELGGSYMRTTSTGYAMTMTFDANGHMTATDSRGCTLNGLVTVPDATYNLYHLHGTVTSCGALDGTYGGMGTLLDADAMQDWMTAMHPLEHGGHSHGGSMMGGSPMMGRNTVPSGKRNLFVFSMVNDHNAIMDALAR